MSGPAPTLGARERELLLCCARLDGGGPHSERAAELVREGLDWEALCLHALLHSVAPLVHLRLSGLAEYERVPAEARLRLLGLSHRAVYQNRHLAREHHDLVEALRAAGIEVIVPKGISLVELVYGGHERRPLIDLVYIVRPHELAGAARALARRGYAARPGHPATAAWRWLCPATTMTIDRGISIMVMLLATAVSRPRLHSFELTDVWSRAERVRVAGAEALVPSPEDLVIYLCAQADAHGYMNSVAAGAIDPGDLLFSDWANNRLIRFVDIRETVRHHAGRIDWEALTRRADQAGLGETVRVGLELTEALLGPTAPDDALGVLDAESRHRFRAWLLEAIRSQVGEGGPRSVAKRWTASWWMELGPRRQTLVPLLFLADFAFCDVGSLRRRHPRWPRAAVPLAYPFRAVWVLVRSALAVAGRLLAAFTRRRRPVLPRSRSRRPQTAAQ